LGWHNPKACQRATVLLGPKKKFTVSYRHGRTCLPCHIDTARHGMKHGRTAQVPPLQSSLGKFFLIYLKLPRDLIFVKDLIGLYSIEASAARSNVGLPESRQPRATERIASQHRATDHRAPAACSGLPPAPVASACACTLRPCCSRQQPASACVQDSTERSHSTSLW
jgi:hypothetical protein